MSTTNKTKTNTVILSSIPLDKSLKRYYLSKYRWLCTHNGAEYAAGIFKQMREIALAYRADRRKPAIKRQEYLIQMPVRKNGWLIKLFDYLDCKPYYVLNFLKLYVGMNQPLTSVEESANTQDNYLQSRETAINTQVPRALAGWLDFIELPYMTKKTWYTVRQQAASKNTWSHSFPSGGYEYSSGYRSIVSITITNRVFETIKKWLRHHSYKEYLSYVSKWKGICTIPEKYRYLCKSDGSTTGYEPLPEMYKDYSFDASSGMGASVSLEHDLYQLATMYSWYDTFGWMHHFREHEVTETMDHELLDWIISQLHPDLQEVLFDEDRLYSVCSSVEKSFLDGGYVGFIHHIPKKGTVTRRPIAVPNRFLQYGMSLCYEVLTSFVHRLPMDATFDQSRFDAKIQNRCNNSDSLYVGSVDLSKATDNLPFTWGEEIWNRIFKPYVSDDVNASWEVFRYATKSRWNNDGILSSWTVGQPLGCLPSFRVLTLTHCFYLESLSLSHGYGHSPYVILGDDVLIFNKKLRKAYIADLTSRGIPLSLHKSYEGNLAEFAGKVYIKNQVPHYVSDQLPIYWSNLFDYQRSTGILIPWQNLPKSLRRRWIRLVTDNGVSGTQAPTVYTLAQLAEVTYTDSPTIHLDRAQELLSSYSYHMAVMTDQDYNSDLQLRIDLLNAHSGIVNISGHPVTYLNYGYAEKNGHKLRFHMLKERDWFKQKFRPVSTDKIASCATLAVIDLKGESSDSVGGNQPY